MLFTLIALQCLSQEKSEYTANYAREITHPVETHNTQNTSYRGGESPIWFSDFSDPGVWQMNTITGSNGFEITTSEQGWSHDVNINSNSGGEYAFVWSGNPDNAVNDAESTMTTVNAIDVSMIESAVLEFQLYGARFYDELFLEVSSNGVDYEIVGDISDIGMLTWFGGTSTANPANRVHNITLNVQNQDSLWLRFTHQTRPDGICYGWFIDDVYLYEALEHDLRIDEVYTNYIEQIYEHTQMPLELFEPLNFGARITNLGATPSPNTSLLVEIYLDGGDTPVFSQLGETEALDPGETDLFWIYTEAAGNQTGTYTVKFEAIQNSEDQFIENNTAEKDFEVTTYTWANDVDVINPNIWDGSNGLDSPSVLPGDAWSLGTKFIPFESDAFCYGMEVNFDGGSDAGTEVSISLWGINGVGLVQLVATNSYTLTEQDADPNNLDFTIIPFDEPVELFPQIDYILALDHPEQENEAHIVCQPYDNDFSTVAYGNYTPEGEDWIDILEISPAIRLLTATEIAVDENNEVKMTVGQNFPNPIDGRTTIPFSLKNASEVSLRVLDASGKVVYQNEFGKFNSGYNEISINNLNLSSGIYTYEVSTDLYTVSNTMISN